MGRVDAAGTMSMAMQSGELMEQCRVMVKNAVKQWRMVWWKLADCGKILNANIGLWPLHEIYKGRKKMRGKHVEWWCGRTWSMAGHAVNTDRLISSRDQRSRMHRRATDGGPGVPLPWANSQASSWRDHHWMDSLRSDGVCAYRTGSIAER